MISFRLASQWDCSPTSLTANCSYFPGILSPAFIPAAVQAFAVGGELYGHITQVLLSVGYLP